MTEKQDRFIETYVLTGNATKAAVAAGYSEKTAKVKGSQLKAQFQNEIHKETQRIIADKVPSRSPRPIFIVRLEISTRVNGLLILPVGINSLVTTVIESSLINPFRVTGVAF